MACTVPPAGRTATRQLGQHQADAGRETHFQVARQVIAVDEGARGNRGVLLIDEDPVLEPGERHERAIGGLEHAAQDDRLRQQLDAPLVVDEQQCQAEEEQVGKGLQGRLAGGVDVERQARVAVRGAVDFKGARREQAEGAGRQGQRLHHDPHQGGEQARGHGPCTDEGAVQRNLAPVVLHEPQARDQEHPGFHER